jgi:hypothetical protein
MHTENQDWGFLLLLRSYHIQTAQGMDDRLEALGSLLLKNSSNSKTLGLTFCTRWLYPICLNVPSFDLAVLRKLFDFQHELY